jgi:hypothetical protein
MSLSTWSLETDSKRWLAVLAATCLVSMVMLAHSFMNALSPADETGVTVQKPATAATDAARTRSEPTWGSPEQSPQQITVIENHEAAANRVSPFEGKNKLLTKRDEMLAQQAEVHRQADYLRQLIAAGKLPAGYGKLTKGQVDEMEKNGETIQ